MSSHTDSKRFAGRKDVFERCRGFGILLIAGGLLLAVPVATMAQNENDFNRFEFALGYSFIRQNLNTDFLTGPGSQAVNFNGGTAQATVNLIDWFGVTGEFGGYYTNSILSPNFPTFQANPSFNSSFDFAKYNTELYSYLFGPHVAYPGHRIRPFGEILFGGARIDNSPYRFAQPDNSFAMSVGGGADLKLADFFSLRLGEVDYLMTTFKDYANGRQDNLKASAGFVFTFGH